MASDEYTKRKCAQTGAPPLTCRSSENITSICLERLVSVDAKLSLGALDFSPLHHSLAVAHKTPIIISNYRADDPLVNNFGKIWCMKLRK